MAAMAAFLLLKPPAATGDPQCMYARRGTSGYSSDSSLQLAGYSCRWPESLRSSPHIHRNAVLYSLVRSSAVNPLPSPASLQPLFPECSALRRGPLPQHCLALLDRARHAGQVACRESKSNSIIANWVFAFSKQQQQTKRQLRPPGACYPHVHTDAQLWVAQ